MPSKNVLQVASGSLRRWHTVSRLELHRWERCASSHHRQRRSEIWIPPLSLKKLDTPLDSTELLIRAGFLRQAYSGVYHMLPLGLRVQEKLEKLIDKHMKSIQASKVSLSSISSQGLWESSGRLSSGSEFFKFRDRKGSKWLLAPTHEEEITKLAADAIHSVNHLPMRLYQVGRKYRDERRPRGGLLRGREFIMKDLYTFDPHPDSAHKTYEEVRQAYRNFLAELGLRYLEARADSGAMGGNLSHEYHFPSAAGEDDIISCDHCDYSRNEEWVASCEHQISDTRSIKEHGDGGIEHVDHFLRGFVSSTIIDQSKTALVKAFAPRREVNGVTVQLSTYAIKHALQMELELDTGAEEAEKVFMNQIAKSSTMQGTVYYLLDATISMRDAWRLLCIDEMWRKANQLDARVVLPEEQNPLFTLLKQASGDSCPQCNEGKLEVVKAIEVGHTFHLGTRYSSKLGLTVKSDQNSARAVPVEMGCHGIGISRLIAATTSVLSDNVGLNWPRAIAPFEVAIVVDGGDVEMSELAVQIYDGLTDNSQPVDVLLDDRTGTGVGYKLKDADLIGYPIILVLGKTWRQDAKVEVQCRRLKVKEAVQLERVTSRVLELLEQL